MLAVMLALLILSGCRNKTPAQDAVQTTEATEPSIANGVEFAPEGNPGIAVETPYLTLYYPEEWQNIVTAEKTETEKGLKLTFRTTVAETEEVLFSLIFSDSETKEGYPLGVLKQSDRKKVHVYSVMNEQIPENWSEEEIRQFGSMQERVNDLIMQLNETPGFDSGM